MDHWEKNGIEGRGEFPPALLNKYKGWVVVLGTGRTVWDDSKRFNQRGYGVVTINNMTLHYREKIDHSCSMHPEEPELWRKLRITYDRDPVFLTHSHSNGHSKTNFNWHIERGGSGTSGLFAVMLALALGYEKVVLCGIPLDDQGHFYDPPGFRDGVFKSDFIRREWREVSQLYFKDRVRSLSGWTRDLLGEPDEQWLTLSK